MHAIKGGWVGQTFALAKRNESGGKKARIRRSKEERKTMVEAYIKKYQSFNNGNFPSLNLTHKEVGGSFYTVREIVREIIQENRVLGPSKLAQDEHINDWLSEQYPLGSIATEPQASLSVSPNGSALVPNQRLGTSEDLVRSSDEHNAAPENKGFDSGQIINGSHVIMKDKGSNKLTDAYLQVSETLELDITAFAASQESRALETERIVEVVSAFDANKTLETEYIVRDFSASDASETMEIEKTVAELSASDASDTLEMEQIAEELSASDLSETLETEETVKEFSASDASKTLETKKNIEELSASNASEKLEMKKRVEFSVSNASVTLETEKTVEEFAAFKAKVTHIAEADVIVETFPLRLSNSTDCLNGNISELTKSLEQVEKVYSGLGKDSLLLDGLSTLGNTAYKRDENPSVPSSGNNSDFVDEKAEENLKDIRLGTSNGPVIQECGVQNAEVETTTKISELASELCEQGQMTAETKVKSCQNLCVPANINM